MVLVQFLFQARIGFRAGVSMYHLWMALCHAVSPSGFNLKHTRCVGNWLRSLHGQPEVQLLRSVRGLLSNDKPLDLFLL